jgi:hypothetical protein
MLSRPLFGSPYQCGTDTPPTLVAIDVPPLEIGHWAGFAPLRYRSGPDFGESAESGSRRVRCHEHNRIRTCKPEIHFLVMRFRAEFRPKREAHSQPFNFVGREALTDIHEDKNSVIVFAAGQRRMGVLF